MTFSQPLYLLLLIPAFAILLAFSRRLHGMTRQRKVIATALRAVILALLIFAIAGLQATRPNKGLTTIFVLDHSASMTIAAQAAARDYIQRSLQALGQDDRAGLIVFGKEAVIDVNIGSLRSLGKIYSNPDTSMTDIAAAIRLAAASFGEGTARRIVLLSDGNETAGDAVAAAEAVALDGVQIDRATLNAGEKNLREVAIREVVVPGETRQEEPFEVRVIAESTHATSGVLRLDRDGVPVAHTPVTLTQGTNSLVISQKTERKPGFYRYRAVLEVPQQDDQNPRNNTGIGFVSVRGKPRVLLLEGREGSASALERALKVYNIDVTRSGVEGAPVKPEDLQGYDAIYLSDFPAQSLTESQMRLIASAVRDSGIGFGMIGGENSFLPGGYYGTPLADVLPVDLNIRQRKMFPSATIVIVADTSGSMGVIEDGVPKVKIAATAASATVNMMSPTDYVGVAGSTDQIEFVAPIQLAKDKAAINHEIGRLDVGGGGIYIRPSLEFAYKHLSQQNTKVRHLILMADGNDADEQEGSFALAQKMVAEKMTVSVVAIGEGKDVPFLKQLAAVGKGGFYLAKQAKELQRLFTKDASMMSRSAIEEGVFLPKVDPGDEVLQNIGLRSIPPLYAYCLASDRPLSRIPMRTAKDDPLLAFWQYGIGTAMAFTSDAQPKWAKEWMGWRDFNAFWAQATRGALRHLSNNNLRIATHREGGKAVADIEAYSPQGYPINNLSAKTKILAPDGSSEEVALRQTGPGRYQSEFNASAMGGYIVSVAEGAGTGAPRVTRAGYALAYPPEYQAIRSNDALLNQITQITGGQALENPVQSFRPSERPGRSSEELWSQLLLLTTLLFPLDIAARRLALPFAEFLSAIRRSLSYRSPKQSAPQVAAIARLQQVKSAPEVTQATSVAPHSSESVSRTPPASDKSQTSSQNTTPLSTTQQLLDIKRKRK